MGSATNDLPQSVIDWLDQWSRAVRDVDFAAARELFSVDVIAFGTRNRRLDHLDALERQQWRPVWPHTEGFAFSLDSARVAMSSDEQMATVMVEWHSTGFCSGEAFERPGRATILLRRVEPGWQAIHTHLSMAPDVHAASGRGIPRPPANG